MMYAVWIEIDTGEWDYVRESMTDGIRSFTSTSPVKVFETKEDAEFECENWNTATVVEYKY